MTSAFVARLCHQHGTVLIDIWSHGESRCRREQTGIWCFVKSSFKLTIALQGSSWRQLEFDDFNEEHDVEKSRPSPSLPNPANDEVCLPL